MVCRAWRDGAATAGVAAGVTWAAFISAYFSSVLPLAWGPISGLLSLYFVIGWLACGRDRPSLVIALLAALLGPAFEGLLVSQGAFVHLTDTHFGLPGWLPFLYLNAAVVPDHSGPLPEHAALLAISAAQVCYSRSRHRKMANHERKEIAARSPRPQASAPAERAGSGRHLSRLQPEAIQHAIATALGLPAGQALPVPRRRRGYRAAVGQSADRPAADRTIWPPRRCRARPRRHPQHDGADSRSGSRCPSWAT